MAAMGNKETTGARGTEKRGQKMREGEEAFQFVEQDGFAVSFRGKGSVTSDTVPRDPV